LGLGLWIMTIMTIEGDYNWVRTWYLAPPKGVIHPLLRATFENISGSLRAHVISYISRRHSIMYQIVQTKEASSWLQRLHLAFVLLEGRIFSRSRDASTTSLSGIKMMHWSSNGNKKSPCFDRIRVVWSETTVSLSSPSKRRATNISRLLRTISFFIAWSRE
jgi:hypothetical protein